MKPNILIIMGSSRSTGNTRKIVDAILAQVTATFIDLSAYNISYYDYEHKNQGDDFIPLAEQMVAADTIILATPVYWYTMSAILKTFMDRLSDLLTIRKDLGRALKGKQLCLVVCSSDEVQYEGFSLPFERTAEYLEMRWGGVFYAWIEAEKLPLIVQEQLDKFINTIRNTKKINLQI